MTELDNLSKSGVTPNLATLHRLVPTGSYSSIRVYCDNQQLQAQEQKVRFCTSKIDFRAKVHRRKSS